MRLLSTSIILGVAGLLPSAVTANGPLVNRNPYDNGNGNICTSEVSLDCTYRDQNNVLQTCISNKVGSDYEPWLYVPEAECSEFVTATITMKMCNRNTRNFAIRPSLPESYFRFKGNDYSVSELGNPIAQGDCITVVRTEPLQKCKSYPMSVQLEGNMVGVAGNSYCYAFQFNKSRSKKIPIVNPAPPAIFTETCAEISQLENGGQNVCNSDVSISCTYTDDSGERRSCIGPNNQFVFLNVREDQCDPNGIQATIFMEMCNKNAGNSGLSITNLLADESTYFRFKGRDYNNLVPNFGGDLAPQECRSYTTVETIDTCKKSWPMSIQMEGNMTGAVQGNSYCYCYLYKQARIEKFPAPTTPPPSPMTLPPVPSPVPLIILEVTDPLPAPGDNGYPPRYVKLTKSGPSTSPIIDDLKLVVIDNGPVWSTAVPLTNWIPGSTGPDYYICNYAQYQAGDACNFLANPQLTPITNQPGCYTLAVVDGGPNTPSFQIYDIFGNIGDCDNTDADFGGGSATRKPGFTDPEDVWVPDQWDVVPGEVVVPPVPLIILEVTDPVDGQYGLPPRYVKLTKSGPSDAPIIDDLSLVVFENGPVWSTAIPVSDPDWPSDSPGPDYYICNVLNEFETGSACDTVVRPEESPITNQPGCYTLAIVSGGPYTPSFQIYDIFGVVGVDCEGTDADFTGGSATRKPGFTQPEDVWVPVQWDVYPGRSTPAPTKQPTLPPTPALRYPAIITEITDPLDAPYGTPPRFVKIKTLGSPLQENLQLVVYENGPVWNTAIPISGLTPTNGDLFICNTIAAATSMSGLCNAISPAGNRITNEPGCYNLAIVRGDQSTFTPYYDVVDIFGINGAACSGTQSDFTGGYARRLPNFVTPRKVWFFPEWEVTKAGSTGGGDPLILYITEIADPADGIQNRFVELYSPNRMDYVITPEDNIILVRYTGSNSDPDPVPFLNLQGLRINEYGFLVLCVTDTCYGGKCQYALGVNSIANNPGNVDVALMRGPYPDGDNEIIDIYGVPGQAVLPSQDFSGGRAIRRSDAISPNNVCVADNWFVIPGGVFGGQTLLCTDTDPGCWSGVGDCQARQPPTPPPVPGPSPTSPSKAGKAGKAGKGITKVDSTSNHAPSKAGSKVNSTHRQPTGNVNSSPTNSSNMGPSKGKVNKRHRRTRRTTRKSM